MSFHPEQSCTHVYDEETDTVVCREEPTIQANAEQITPTAAVLAGTGPVQFDISYVNMTGGALSNARLNELQGYLTQYASDFADTLAPQAPDPILVRTRVVWAQIGARWEAFFQAGANPPQLLMASNLTGGTLATVEYPMGTTSVEIFFNTSNNQVEFPGSSSIVENNLLQLVNGRCYEIGVVGGGGIEIRKTGGVATAYANDTVTLNPYPSGSFTSVNGSTNWQCSFAQIGQTILGQAGPRARVVPGSAGESYTPADRVSCTGVDVTVPPTNGFGTVGGTTLSNYTQIPAIFSSQWRFMRLFLDWEGTTLGNQIDASFSPGSILDIEVFMNIDSNRLDAGNGFYFGADSVEGYTGPGGQISLRGVFVHELHHGLGYLRYVEGRPGPNAFTTSLFNHFTFLQPNVPANSTEFTNNTVNRSIKLNGTAGDNIRFSNGIFNFRMFQDYTHLHPTTNGIMVPSAPGGGRNPTAQDMNPLLGMCIDGANAICVHADTLVRTRDGEKPIRDIVTGDEVLAEDGEWTAVLGNLEFRAEKQFILVPVDSVAPGLPRHDTYIREGHSVKLGEDELCIEQLIGRGNEEKVRAVTLAVPSTVYTLKTEKRSFVEMQGLYVGTWSRLGAENFFKHDKKGRTLVFTEH